jgi:hypothetical protein
MPGTARGLHPRILGNRRDIDNISDGETDEEDEADDAGEGISVHLTSTQLEELQEARPGLNTIYEASLAALKVRRYELGWPLDCTGDPADLTRSGSERKEAEEKHWREEAEEERCAEATKQAMVLARAARSIMLEGGLEGSPHHDKMGVYELVEGREVNGRAVWKAVGVGGQEEAFLYYNCTTCCAWLISDREDMEARRNRAWLANSSDALTPSVLLQGWFVVPDAAKGICSQSAPEVSTQVI